MHVLVMTTMRFTRFTCDQWHLISQWKRKKLSLRRPVCPPNNQPGYGISFEELIYNRTLIFGMYDSCEKPYSYCHHASTLTFDLLQGQICFLAGDHNSSNLNLLVSVHLKLCINKRDNSYKSRSKGPKSET